MIPKITSFLKQNKISVSFTHLDKLIPDWKRDKMCPKNGENGDLTSAKLLLTVHANLVLFYRDENSLRSYIPSFY